MEDGGYCSQDCECTHLRSLLSEAYSTISQLRSGSSSPTKELEKSLNEFRTIGYFGDIPVFAKTAMLCICNNTVHVRKKTCR